jgi:hypothetical protein
VYFFAKILLFRELSANQGQKKLNNWETEQKSYESNLCTRSINRGIEVPQQEKAAVNKPWD